LIQGEQPRREATTHDRIGEKRQGLERGPPCPLDGEESGGAAIRISGVHRPEDGGDGGASAAEAGRAHLHRLAHLCFAFRNGDDSGIEGHTGGLGNQREDESPGGRGLGDLQDDLCAAAISDEGWLQLQPRAGRRCFLREEFLDAIDGKLHPVAGSYGEAARRDRDSR
jgi:hypothetical protein